MSQSQQVTGSASQAWQVALAEAVTDLSELCRILKLPDDICSPEAASAYPLLVTRSFLDRIEIGNPHDPLLLQILPSAKELAVVPGFTIDPLAEMCCANDGKAASSQPKPVFNSKNSIFSQKNSTPCQLQKYEGRVLILASNGCATHCRFCFRRHFSTQSETFLKSPQKNDFSSTIREVILSGGDPLMLNDNELKQAIHYIKESYCGNRVRIHTRLPIMIPERITKQLIQLFREYQTSPEGNAVYFVLHINHPNELSDDVTAAIARLIDAGFPVLSQTVLLRGVNDNFETLFRLFETLVNHRVLPYYLHQLDHVAGASHFYVPVENGTALIDQLRKTLPGYAVPKYVTETVGGSSKSVLR